MSDVSPSDVQSEATRVSGAEVEDGVDQQEKYTVQRGDTMTHIARDHGVSLNDLVSANPQVSNPDRINVGQELNLPGASPTGTTPGRVPNPGEITELTRGARGPEVEALQTRLNELGYNAGTVDGIYGRNTQAAVRSFQLNNDLQTNGRVDEATKNALQSPDARRPDPSRTPQLQVYTPGSPEQIALFQEAARAAGLPESWASSRGLINLLNAESGGKVGVPNYTYGERARDPSQWASVHDELRAGNITARSSATGLGQLLLSNVERYYPSGRQGIGNPHEEAVGMLRYISDRYGNPDTAWNRYNTLHEGY